VKKNTRDVAATPSGGASERGVSVEPMFEAGAFDARSGFDDVRYSLSGQLERELDSLLLVRSSLDRLLNALLVRAPQRRTALGLAAFELDDWKEASARAEPEVARAAFAQLARELRQRVRSSDELGRIGESSVCIVLLGCEAHVLGGVAERLRLAVDGKLLGRETDGLRASLAVATVSAYPRPGGPSAAALIAELCGGLERRC
jgi:GGDEF domain-containing protein